MPAKAGIQFFSPIRTVLVLRNWIPAFAGMAFLYGNVSANDEATDTASEHAQPALSAPKAAQNRLLDIAATGSQLVAVGEQGAILISEDAKTWQQVKSPVNVMLTRLHFTDDSTGWALGYDATILKTIDGGNTWAVQHYDAAARALYDLLFLDAQHGLAVGAYGSLFETTDGGQTWTRRESELSALGMHFNAILKLGDGSLFIAGERGLMARSVDAGATWQVLDFPYAGSMFGALPSGEKGVLVYGMRGNVFEAVDVSACATMDTAAWDSYERENLEDAARIAELGWRRLENPVRESLFGALSTRTGPLLVGVNGTSVKLDASAGALAPLKTPATETLARVVAFKGRLIGVGRKGVQDLGTAP
ncbi:MAG: WD40/YVTN/BNR-like repeat-containing protein [Panacagrimonas sp.]